MNAKLERIYDNGEQTLGKLYLYNNETIVYRCLTLELPFKNNENRISCIPEGTYDVVFRDGKESGSRVAPYPHYHIPNVKNRSWILIHRGNYNYNTLGCILVGSSFSFINNDHNLDIGNSKNTLDTILSLAPKGFKLHIVNDFKYEMD